MVKNIRIEFLTEGFREILTSEPMRQLVTQTARDVAARAGDGFTFTTRKGGFGGGRHIAYVSADTHAARVAEATRKSLTKAVQGMSQ